MVRVRRSGDGFEVGVEDGAPVPARAHRSADGTRLTVTRAGRTRTFARAADPESAHRWVGADGLTWTLHEEPVTAALREDETAADGTVRSPMPGTVLDVPVEIGQEVAAGTALAVVEAMKMEHSVPSPVDGTVTAAAVAPGTPVPMDAVLVTVTPDPGPDTHEASTATSPATSEEQR